MNILFYLQIVIVVLYGGLGLAYVMALLRSRRLVYGLIGLLAGLVVGIATIALLNPASAGGMQLPILVISTLVVGLIFSTRRLAQAQ